MNPIILPEVDLKELAPKAQSILERALAIRVVDQSSLDVALNEDRAAQKLQKLIETRFKEDLLDPLNKAKDGALRMKEAAMDPTVQSRKIIKDKILTFNRQATEAAEKAAQEAAAIAKKQEEERLLAKAGRLEKEGRNSEAMAVISRPVFVPTPAPDVPVLTKASVTKVKNCRVSDKLSLVLWIASHPEHLGCLDENMSELRKLARANVIPDGVEVFEEERLTTRS